MACDIFDLRCILVNELIGSAFLAMLFVALIYFLLAGKLRWGFDTTITLAFPILLASGLVIYGFAAVYAFGTLLAGVILALAFLRLVGNK